MFSLLAAAATVKARRTFQSLLSLPLQIIPVFCFNRLQRAMNQTITVTRRGAERARAGHLWIYRSDVRDASAVKGGTIVRVVDERKRYVGQALYSDRSEISLRLLTLSDE